MRLVLVDLSNGKVSCTSISREVINSYLGGRGLGVRMLYDLAPANVDPLSDENPLIFLTSELMGTGIPGAVKTCIATKSPLSGTVLMSLAGGDFGLRLRAAGIDGLVVTGKAESPCFLAVEKGEVRICDAGGLWGLTTDECSRELLPQGTQHTQVACIGPAGERGVLFASVMSDGHAFGRGGTGAVMGSKNLKAIVVHGRAADIPHIEPRDEFRSLLTDIARRIKQSPRLARFGKYGTSGNISLVNERGLLPTRNYSFTQFAEANSVSGENLQPLMLRRFGCPGCPVRCRRLVQMKTGPHSDLIVDGPEYETIWAFGPHLENGDLDSILAAAWFCNSYGVDTISMGNVLGFLADCLERGILCPDDIGSADFGFGNVRDVPDLIRLTALKEGIGSLLALGVKRAAQRLGEEAEGLAAHVKGLEMSGYDPRGAKGMGLGYATSPRGACHERAFLAQETFGAPPPMDRLAYKGKGRVVKQRQDEVAILDSLGICVFAAGPDAVTMEDLARFYSMVSGSSFTTSDFQVIGERICNLERLYNLREGLVAADDDLPDVIKGNVQSQGPSKGHTVEIEAMLTEYYAARGWTQDGRLTREQEINALMK